MLFTDSRVWYASFVDATSTKARFGLVSLLPRTLSGGWRPIMADAMAVAEKDGQNAVRARLQARLNAALTHAIGPDARAWYPCSGPGMKAIRIGLIPDHEQADPNTGLLPAECFGPRKQSRSPGVYRGEGTPLTGALADVAMAISGGAVPRIDNREGDGVLTVLSVDGFDPPRNGGKVPARFRLTVQIVQNACKECRPLASKAGRVAE